ncbi:uncharacterized protein LOC114944008 [Nylanderia fulva]|uniref:uncharacterized protein LOC114944008 n=1 Tax=Nylanderia fulva TaxID=613905 RepID=UPI0010FAE9E0|nr:uncharacterized protein LOC114944008 [Nylanderia fulva]
METRLDKDSDLSSQYRDFLSEYESLGHMTRVDEAEITETLPVYIPHHPVMREESCTTKLRIVFNASCKTRNGTSLNDHLLVGPKLQQDLPAVLTRWRKWRLVYTADIAKMFRQIRVHSKDVDFQRILWRPTADAPITHFRLLTVTYGLASAPYLSMRVLRQLALDEGADFPAAVPIINDSIYVDDALFGADNFDSLLDTRTQLVELLKRGDFLLRKWASNCDELLDNVTNDQSEVTNHLVLKDELLRILGLSWLPSEDSFQFTVKFDLPIVLTKRSILSCIAKLYDPLGWAAPVVITAKIILQELWLLRYDWDTPLPNELSQRWTAFASDLSSLESIRIPRWTGQSPDNLTLELHGFADASNRAYAAVVIPRLELNAVVLLSRLVKWLINSLNFSNTSIHCWTDSTITLAWLRQHPSKWTTYVANRVSEVQCNLPSAKWSHVPSKENPADCASRGFNASDIVEHSLWWAGPPWLQQPSTSWPPHNVATSLSEELVKQVHAESRKSAVLHVEGTPEWDLPHRFGCWTRLVRVTAYIYRFFLCSRNKTNSEDTTVLYLGVDELRRAETFWLAYAQKRSFELEFKTLRKDETLPHKSSLKSLNPFVGKDSLLRLGGRLRNSALSYKERHPIIIPRGRIAELLIDHAHRISLHGGVQLVLRTLRQNYWLLGGRSTVKFRIRQCIVCARYAKQQASQLMGDLPSPRVNPSSPFTHTGVDYAGPFFLTPFVSRGQKTRKHYIALFICLATKAIHIELVEDYSAAGFLAAFRRFASRRGLPQKLYSDNGTNFHGADRELKSTFDAVSSDPSLRDVLANDRVEWHFIPSASPHFGGLWEAGVKSFKTHLKKTVGSHTLSQAEFSTLLCRIEACLNSRPIATLSDDPSDLLALTPGHFLIGRPMTAVPEESVLAINENRLS